jgi:sarcosine oxidase subunit beta
VTGTHKRDVAVVGAGTTGSAIAFHLTQRGMRPLLIDRTGPAGGPSGSSAGMLRRYYDDPAIVDMARHGCTFLAEMEERTGSPSGYVGCGYVVVAGADDTAQVRATYEVMRAQGVKVELIDVDDMRDLEPRLRTDDLAIGCYEPTGGYCDPLFVADGLAQAARRAGAVLRMGAEVTSIAADGAGYRLAIAGADPIAVEICIVACGGWSNGLLRALGGEVPLTLRRGQVGRYRPPASAGGPGPIISDHVHDVWLRPDGPDGHYLVGGRGGRPDEDLSEPQTTARGADDATLGDFARELAWRIPALAGGVWRGSWASFYDFTPDGNPVVDRLPGHDNLIVATGGSGHAFKLAPALGLGVSELVCDGRVESFDFAPLAFGRFG